MGCVGILGIIVMWKFDTKRSNSDCGVFTVMNPVSFNAFYSILFHDWQQYGERSMFTIL